MINNEELSKIVDTAQNQNPVEATPAIPEAPMPRTPEEFQAAHRAALDRQRRERQQLAELDHIFDDLDRRIAEWTNAATALGFRSWRIGTPPMP